MSKDRNNKTDKQKLSRGKILLLCFAILFLSPAFLFSVWYGLTYLPVKQVSAFPAKEITVSSGDRQCTLEIPSVTLDFRHPRRTAVGSTYQASAEVRLDQAPRFSGCTGGMANWNINLEAQTSFVASNVQPFAAIRQPAVNREEYTFDWTFTPEEPINTYQSHLWLRVIVSEQDETIERWNILVRDFPMENDALFGLPTVLWLIISGFSALIGLLLLILVFQKRKG